METAKNTNIGKVYKKIIGSTQFSVMCAVFALGVLFTILSPYFLTFQNLLNIGAYAAIMGIMATGETMALITGGLDISIAAVAAFAGMIVATLIQSGYPIWVSIIVALLGGTAAGTFNALLNTKLRINALITTLATMSIFRSLSFIVSSGRTITITNDQFLEIGRGDVLGVPNLLLLMILVMAIGGYVMSQTSFGRKLYAIGGNSYASFLSGINITKVKFGLFMMGGTFSAFAGILMASQTGAGLPQAANGAEMNVIAAVILGGVSLSGGKGNMIGTFLGVFLMAMIQNGMVLLSIESYYQLLVKGVILVIAVFIDVLRNGGEGERTK